ncbi:putative serine/threonine-protein kinase pbl3 [Orobanche hederae]
MGNCMQKNKEVVLEIEGVENDSKEYIREKEDDVEYDDVGTIIACNNGDNHSNEFRMGSILRFENQMDDFHNRIPPNRAPPSVSMEKDHRKISHPLPTPNLAPQHLSRTQDRNKKTDSNLILPLPKPESSNPKSVQESISTTRDASSSSSLTACILPMPISESEILSSPYLKAFSLDELRRATSDFSEDSMLGEGGFGCVYKGWLAVETLTAARQGSGMAVAIKRLIPYGFQGHKEWLSEVNYLGRLHHPNLVKLIGYCIEGEDRILVYEYMPGGSLERHLFKRHAPCLSWARRIKVAVGAARGLCFLHESKSPVIYRDFKTSNILLDSEFNAKLSDFGLAKAGPTESQTHVSTRVMGTEGYCDPRYLATGKLTLKCDVYSFGVVLLELLTGRRAIDESKCREEKNLVNWVRIHVLDNGKVFRIMDTKLEGQYCKRSAYVAANIALRCVNHEPKYRPPMTYILEILENLPSSKRNRV